MRLHHGDLRGPCCRGRGPQAPGRALAGYSNFESRGLYIRALFDVAPEKTVREVRGLKVYGMDRLPEYLRSHDIDIAVLTIPKEQVRQVAQQLYDEGIRGFWNFAHVDLELPDDAVVENVHLSESLMQLTYYMKHQKYSEETDGC